MLRVRVTIDAMVGGESVDYSPGMRTSHRAICEQGACKVVAGRIGPEYLALAV